jgi:hydroxymethylbilane synthase
MPTWLAVTAERTVSRAMGGSCSMPLAAFTRGPASAGDKGMLLEAAWGDPLSIDAAPGSLSNVIKPLVHARSTSHVCNFAQAEALGNAVAAQLRAGGAVWAQNEALQAAG